MSEALSAARPQPSAASPTTSIIAFRPARLLSNPHLQTLIPYFAPARMQTPGVPRRVGLPGGDHVVLQDDCPPSWTPGDPAVLLMHGLCGCHQSGYMIRMADKLRARGARAFRMDHRGCGAGEGLAREPYHAGRTDDVRNVLLAISALCPGSPLSAVGFSLSGNVLLRHLGEDPDAVPDALQRVVVVSPPVALAECVAYLGRNRAGLSYDRRFASWLYRHVRKSPQWRDDAPLARATRPPRRVVDFDELYTAPVAGFRSASHYYECTSAAPVIPAIRIPTTILAALDDPLVPARPVAALRNLPPNVTVHITDHGGHVGFLGRGGVDDDRNWMDWRLLEWLLA